MPTPRPRNPVVIALTANAVLLALLLVAVTGRPWTAAARADVPAPAATARGLTIMPAQVTANTYGCFVLDADGQTLLAYQFLGHENQLKLVAARDVQYDRRLTNFNTVPSPQDVRQLNDAAAAPDRAAPPQPPRSPER